MTPPLILHAAPAASPVLLTALALLANSLSRLLACSWRGPGQVAHGDAPGLQPVAAALQSPTHFLLLLVQRQQVPLAALQPEQEDGARGQHEPRPPVTVRSVGDGGAARAHVPGGPALAAAHHAPQGTAGPGGGLPGGGEGEPATVRGHPLGGPASGAARASGRPGAGE